MFSCFLVERTITHLFPIQAKTFNAILEGKDVIARARKYSYVPTVNLSLIIDGNEKSKVLQA